MWKRATSFDAFGCLTELRGSCTSGSCQKIRQDKIRTLNQPEYPPSAQSPIRPAPSTSVHSSSKGPTSRQELPDVDARPSVRHCKPRQAPTSQPDAPVCAPASSIAAHCPLKPSLLRDTGISTLTATTESRFHSIHSSPNKQPQTASPLPITTHAAHEDAAF